MVCAIIRCAALLLLRLAFPSASQAQELREEPTPSSVWLDFRALAARPPSRAELPAWLDSVSFEPEAVPNQADLPVSDRLRFRESRAASVTIPATYRLHFHALGEQQTEMQLRLFFLDQKDAAPVVTGWSETGALLFKRGPLGEGLGLPSSQTLTLPMEGVDYIDIAIRGDPRTVRSAFLAMLKEQALRRAADFTPPADMIDAFGNLPPATPKLEDSKLYGRVRATIDAAVVKLTPRETAACTWEFELRSPPLLAIVSFEILNADALAPLEVILNDRPLGAAPAHLPDLADPGFLGFVRPLDRGMRFRYSGWLRCQKAIPGSALVAGLNKLTLQLNKESGPVAVRALELQLKHNSKTLDYTLSPSAQ